MDASTVGASMVDARTTGRVVQKSASVAAAAPARAFRRPLARRKRVVLPLVGFAATFAFMSASLVNPLSGAYASTPSVAPDASVAPGAVTPIAGQTYTVASGANPSAARDAYTVNYTAPVVAKPKVVAAPTTTPADPTAESTPAAAPTTPAAPAATPGSAQAIGAELVAAHGWGTDQYSCLVSLWNKESGWNVYAANPSGAYGIPQALPGSKMSTAGADWQTSARTQITWGLSYISGSYGTPCAAWAHSEANNWY